MRSICPSQVVLDFLEVILDAAEAAALPAGLEEEEEKTCQRQEVVGKVEVGA